MTNREDSRSPAASASNYRPSPELVEAVDALNGSRSRRSLSSQLLDLEDRFDTARHLAAALEVMMPSICDDAHLNAVDAVQTALQQALDAVKQQLEAIRLGGAA